MLERIESLGVPRIRTLFRALVAGGAAAGIATGQLRVDVHERSARVNVGDGSRIGEFIPHVAAHTYEQDQKTGDDGECDHTLPDRSKASSWLAFGNRVAAGSVRKWAVLALATTGSRARAGPVSLHLSRFHLQPGRAFIGRPALSRR